MKFKEQKVISAEAAAQVSHRMGTGEPGAEEGVLAVVEYFLIRTQPTNDMRLRPTTEGGGGHTQKLHSAITPTECLIRHLCTAAAPAGYLIR